MTTSPSEFEKYVNAEIDTTVKSVKSITNCVLLFTI
jgi:hypothetical protein